MHASDQFELNVARFARTSDEGNVGGQGQRLLLAHVKIVEQVAHQLVFSRDSDVDRRQQAKRSGLSWFRPEHEGTSFGDEVVYPGDAYVSLEQPIAMLRRDRLVLVCPFKGTGPDCSCLSCKAPCQMEFIHDGAAPEHDAPGADLVQQSRDAFHGLFAVGNTVTISAHGMPALGEQVS
jgi:hypothetical protein